MAETRAQMLQREYLANLQNKPSAPAVVDHGENYRGKKDAFWIYIRPFTLLYPVLPPYPMKFTLCWHEINQIKYGNNTYHHGK